MTTVSVTTTAGKLASDAASAARQLRERLKEEVAGSANVIAHGDMVALAVALETAAAACTSPQSSGAYALSWSTSGANDATTKTVALDFLYGDVKPPKCGLEHGHAPARLAPKLGDDLATLINSL